jgi:hypothetical protein
MSLTGREPSDAAKCQAWPKKRSQITNPKLWFIQEDFCLMPILSRNYFSRGICKMMI